MRFVHRLLDKGERRFDDEVHDELERFLVALYVPKIRESCAKLIEQKRAWSIEYGTWIRSQLQGGRARAEVEQLTEHSRTELIKEVEEWRAAILHIVPDDPDELAESRPWHSIRALEDEVLETQFDAWISQPILDDFDARTEEAFNS